MFRSLLALLLLAALPAQAGSPETTARAYIEMFNTADFTGIDALVSKDYRGQTMAAGQPLAEGPAGLQAWIEGIHAMLPGTKTVESIARDGEHVVVDVQLTAPHPKGGAPIAARQVHWLRLDGGKIAEDRVFFDLGSVIAQLKEDR